MTCDRRSTVPVVDMYNGFSEKGFFGKESFVALEQFLQTSTATFTLSKF